MECHHPVLLQPVTQTHNACTMGLHDLVHMFFCAKLAVLHSPVHLVKHDTGRPLDPLIVVIVAGCMAARDGYVCTG